MSLDPMKIRTGYVLLCESYSPGQGNKHVYVGVFNRIFTNKFPAVYHQCCLAIELWGPPGEDFSVSVRFVDSDENDVLPRLGPIKGKFSNFGNATIHAVIQGLRLPRPGFFSFQVLHDDKPIGDRMLFVEEAKAK